MSSSSKEASSNHVLPMVPFLVATDPNTITEHGHAILLDSNGERLTHDFEALRGSTRFAATCQGWILSLGSEEQEDNRRAFLYDPYTCDKIELPRFDDAHQLPRDFEAALSSDKPRTTNTIVVVLHPDETTLWYCRVVAVGGEQQNDAAAAAAAAAAEWIKYEYDLGTQKCDAEGLVRRKIIIRHLTACQGRFFFPTTIREHGVLEFVDPHPAPAIRVVAMGGVPQVVPPNPWGWCAKACRFEMDGEHYQFLAYYFEDPAVTTGIALYRMDVLGRQRWCEVVDGIGDRALLWCGYGGGCCTASKFGLEPGCVYMIHPRDNLMHVFSIAKRTERVCFHPAQDLAKLPSGAFWLIPTNTDSSV